MKLYEKIRILRKVKGWSQEELGYKLSKDNELGISRQAVSDWENGKSEPKLNNIRDLANVFGVSFDCLLDEEVDLNDNEQLTKALGKSSKTENEDIVIIKEGIYKKIDNKKKYIKTAIWFSVTLVLLAIGISLLFFNNNTAFIIGYVLIALAGGYLIYFLITNCFEIRNILKHKNNELVGTLNNYELVLYIYRTQLKINSDDHIPYKRIEYIKITKMKGKYYGDIEFKVQGIKKPYNLIDIYEPQKLVDLIIKLKDENLKEILK